MINDKLMPYYITL